MTVAGAAIVARAGAADQWVVSRAADGDTGRGARIVTRRWETPTVARASVASRASRERLRPAIR
jgi:hypothetical protein